MLVKDKNFEVFLSAEELNSVVSQMAAQIEKNYAGRRPYFLIMMTGAFVFASDLLRAMKSPVEMAIVKYSSYDGMSSTGEVKRQLKVPEEIRGRDVIVLEDIVDTGTTMHAFMKELQTYSPKTVALASLLTKSEVLQGKVKIDYLGKDIPNKFVVGYGLDYDGYGRNLPAIYALSEK